MEQWIDMTRLDRQFTIMSILHIRFTESLILLTFGIDQELVLIKDLIVNQLTVNRVD